MKNSNLSMFIAQQAKQQASRKIPHEKVIKQIKPTVPEYGYEVKHPKADVPEIEQYRTLVEGSERLKMLPKYFGTSGFGLTFDHKFFNQMRKLCPEYDGGYWDYYELCNGGFYMSWNNDEPVTMYDPNGGSYEMSADAASVAVGLILYSNCCAYFYENNQTLSDRFYNLNEQLYDFAYTHHPEGALIRSIAN